MVCFDSVPLYHLQVQLERTRTPLVQAINSWIIVAPVTMVLKSVPWRHMPETAARYAALSVTRKSVVQTATGVENAQGLPWAYKSRRVQTSSQRSLSMDVHTFFCAWRYVHDFCSRFFLRKSAPASRKHLHMRSISSFLLHTPQYLRQYVLLNRHIHWITLPQNISSSSWILALYRLNLRWPEISNKVLGLSARCTWGSVRSVRFVCVCGVSALLIILQSSICRKWECIMSWHDRKKKHICFLHALFLALLSKEICWESRAHILYEYMQYCIFWEYSKNKYFDLSNHLWFDMLQKKNNR